MWSVQIAEIIAACSDLQPGRKRIRKRKNKEIGDERE